MGAGDRLASGGDGGSTGHFGGAGMELLLWGCSSPAPFGPLHGPLGTAEVEPPAGPGTPEPWGRAGCGRAALSPSPGDTPGRRDSGGRRGARTHLPEAVGRFLRGRCRLVVGARHGCGCQCGRWAAVGQTPASCTVGRHGGEQGNPGPPARGTSIRLRGQGRGRRLIQPRPTDPSRGHPLGAIQPPELLCWERAAGAALRVSPARTRLSTACPRVSPWGQWLRQGWGGGMRCPKKFSLHSTLICPDLQKNGIPEHHVAPPHGLTLCRFAENGGWGLVGGMRGNR